MKRLSLLSLLWLLPTLGISQPTRIELGPDSDDAARSASRSGQRQAHERAVRKNAYATRVRYVEIKGRWARHVQLPLAPGDLLTPGAIFSAMEALEAAIATNTVGFGFRFRGELGVLYIEVDFDTNAPPANASALTNGVGVIFRPYFVGFSLVQFGNNTLPIPRSPWPTFYDHVPKPLLALNPGFAVSYDRAFGAAACGSVEADLLHLDRTRKSPAGTDHRLDLGGGGTKSLEEPFYRADAHVSYHARPVGETLRELSWRAGYDGAREPLGEGEHTRQAAESGFGVSFKLAPNARLSFDTGYRRADDDVSDAVSTESPSTTTDEQVNRLLLDAIPRRVHGFLRAAVWEDNGWWSGASGSYQRLVGRLGYAKEFPLGRNQTVGLELVGGAGKVWGDPPSHARFFAGSEAGQFLYDNPSAASLLAMPAGPLLRSVGQAEAGLPAGGGRVSGGDAFWHLNINLTLPIRPWSRPLIPDEPTDLPDADGQPTTLKRLLKNQIDVTAPSMLTAALKAEGRSDEQARRQAKAILDEVRPATHFIIDDANVLAIKPLLMFDAVGLSGDGQHETWLAAGGGVQLTIVTARFELGYMHTLSGPTFGSRGSVFARLVFQNLF